MDPGDSSVRYAVTADGTRIAFRVRGSGPVLLFARGWITHLERTDDDPAVRAFFGRLEHHFRVVRYDGRGNGMSDRSLPEPVTLDHLVDDLASVADAVAESPVILWGSSWGGPAAIHYAATVPDAVHHLVLDGTYPCGADLAPPERAESFLRLLDTARSQPDAVFASMSYMTDPEPTLSHTARIERVRQSIDPDALIALYTLLYQMDVRASLPQITCPTLVLHRRGSRAVPMRAGRAIAEGIAGASFVALDGTAHNPWEEDSGAVFRALAEFLHLPDLTQVDAAARAVRSASVVYVDQEASTAQLRLLGDRRGARVQAAMIRLLRDVMAPFEAETLADTGDGMAFIVPSAADAVAAAQVIQRRATAHNLTVPKAERIGLRVGVHAGELQTLEEGRTYGIAIAYAARLCDLARAGQILVSDTVAGEAQGVIGPPGFRELDGVELKGIGRATPYEVRW